jgi:hypothetical protein
MYGTERHSGLACLGNTMGDELGLEAGNDEIIKVCDQRWCPVVYSGE